MAEYVRSEANRSTFFLQAAHMLLTNLEAGSARPAPATPLTALRTLAHKNGICRSANMPTQPYRSVFYHTSSASASSRWTVAGEARAVATDVMLVHALVCLVSWETQNISLNHSPLGPTITLPVDGSISHFLLLHFCVAAFGSNVACHTWCKSLLYQIKNTIIWNNT